MKLATCHPERKEQARGYCKSCYDKWLKDNNPGYKKNQESNTAKWVKSNPEKMQAAYERRKEKQKNDPLYKSQRRNQHIKRKYGIDQAGYEKLLSDQNGGCALCFRKPTPGKYLHIDHSHTNGKVRGLLCHQCNWYLGTVDSDYRILDRIKEYLNA